MPECNILENLSIAEQKEFRRSFVDIILSTDLAKHWDLTSRFKTRVRIQILDIEISDFFKDCWRGTKPRKVG
jgi:hypothetical protein